MIVARINNMQQLAIRSSKGYNEYWKKNIPKRIFLFIINHPLFKNLGVNH